MLVYVCAYGNGSLLSIIRFTILNLRLILSTKYVLSASIIGNVFLFVLFFIIISKSTFTHGLINKMCEGISLL